MPEIPKDELARRLLDTFVAEEKERVQAITRHLLALERGVEEAERERLLAEILREAHNLKGAARIVGLDEIGRLSHALETCFEAVARGEVALTPEACDSVYRALDAIGALMKATEAGEQPVVDVAGHLRSLDPSAMPAPSQRRRPRPKGKMRRQPARPEKTSTVVSEPSPQAAPDTGRARRSRPAEEAVRVSTEKLDSLLASVSELRVAGASLERSIDEIRALSERLASWQRGRRRFRARQEEPAVAGNGTAQRRTEGQLRARARAAHARLEESEEVVRSAQAVVEGLRRQLEASSRRVSQATAELEGEVRRARTVPLSTLLDGFHRMVRDLARARGKTVSLVVAGGALEVDRALLEQLRDPLTHLLRNSVDHGIEPPDERQRKGKAAEGTVGVRASQHGDELLVEIEDDGAGLDLERIVTSGLERGLISPDQARSLGGEDLERLIFRSGLSTSPEVTDLSGRGIGLDVVRDAVERLHGSIHVESAAEEGTRFRLQLPLAVATTRCLLVRAGGTTLALPVASIDHIVRVGAESVRHAEGRTTVQAGGEPVLAAPLSELLGLAGFASSEERPPAAPRPAIVVGSLEQRAALLVDALLGAEELVVKSLPPPLVRVRDVGGAGVLASGEPVVVLNVSDLLRHVARWEPGSGEPPASALEAERRAPVVLVVEDSITTRSLEKSILETAGYQVEVAADGTAAWSLLQSGRCDLVVSDVLMPGMDGFELTERIRADERLRDMPVVLVTSLESRESRERAVAAGADAYVVKSAFDQQSLLETIRRLI